MGTLRTGKHSRGGGLGVRDTPDHVATYAIRTVDGTKPSVRFAISSCHSGPEDPPNLVGIDRTCPNGRSPREPRQKFRAGAGRNLLGITKNRGSSAVHGEERHYSSPISRQIGKVAHSTYMTSKPLVRKDVKETHANFPTRQSGALGGPFPLCPTQVSSF